VAGIEKNPVAHGYALRNLQANRTVHNVRFFEGDAGEVLAGSTRTFDRVLIVLPHGGEALLPPALDALRPGGTLHFYDLQAKGCHHVTAAKVEAACRETGRRIRCSPLVAVCGHCGPTVHRICLDVVIEPMK
jgi:tRNA (guanine37-N1)-methyltransferase